MRYSLYCIGVDIKVNSSLKAMMLNRLSRFCRFFSEIQSVEGHKPPAFTDQSSGRYAGSLFSAASRSNALSFVKHDLEHLGEVIKTSGPFR
jgi:hypothetical protein